MDAERATLDVGRIVRAHGLKGDVLVDLWTDRLERLTPGATLFSDRGALVVESAQAHQQRHLVRFDRIGSREEAEHWRGVVLSARRLDDPSAIWVDQLFGAEVVDTKGVSHGVVVEVESNPASDLMVLDSGALVPLTFVIALEANSRVKVDVPEGLFE